MSKQNVWVVPCIAMAGWTGVILGLTVTKEKAVYAAAGKSLAQAKTADTKQEQKSAFRVAGVRYQVKDVARAVAFYTQRLDFKVDQQQGPAFARVTKGNLILWLSGPGSSGSRPMPDGRKQEPGGWNRIALEVDDLPSHVATMKKAGLRFRNEIETGPGGKQIQLEDPDGNPVELFEPAIQPKPVERSQ
jgi:glyoxylase I family protein